MKNKIPSKLFVSPLDMSIVSQLTSIFKNEYYGGENNLRKE